MIRGSEDWVTCGKSIRKLIEELQTFENQDLEIQISIVGGEVNILNELKLKGRVNEVNPFHI